MSRESKTYSHKMNMRLNTTKLFVRGIPTNLKTVIIGWRIEVKNIRRIRLHLEKQLKAVQVNIFQYNPLFCHKKVRACVRV